MDSLALVLPRAAVSRDFAGRVPRRKTISRPISVDLLLLPYMGHAPSVTKRHICKLYVMGDLSRLSFRAWYISRHAVAQFVSRIVAFPRVGETCPSQRPHRRDFPSAFPGQNPRILSLSLAGFCPNLSLNPESSAMTFPAPQDSLNPGNESD